MLDLTIPAGIGARDAASAMFGHVFGVDGDMSLAVSVHKRVRKLARAFVRFVLAAGRKAPQELAHATCRRTRNIAPAYGVNRAYTIAMLSVIRLPGGLQRHLNLSLRALLDPQTAPRMDFSRPVGEAALVAPDSVSWRIFKNPISLFIGGVTAVILELAEPAVRTGVWEHSTFRTHPIGRLRRTGLAAMVTVYGARSVAEPMIKRIVQLHTTIGGETPQGTRYAASDPQLLAWVHTTAAFSFAGAYSRYVDRLSPAQMNRLYRESQTAARLYGVLEPPESIIDVESLFERMRGLLEPSPILFEFLQIMRAAPAFPRALQWIQPLLVRAAVDLIPEWLRSHLGLHESYGLRACDSWPVKLAAELANRIVLAESPAAQACMRLGLSPTYLYR